MYFYVKLANHAITITSKVDVSEKQYLRNF